MSPLKALAGDIRGEPRTAARGDQRRGARSSGWPVPDLRVVARTGDTTPIARAAMSGTRRTSSSRPPSRSTCSSPPPGAARRLRRVRTVIVDEIHAVARDKRGSHLALTLERLDAPRGRPQPHRALRHPAADRRRSPGSSSARRPAEPSRRPPALPHRRPRPPPASSTSPSSSPTASWRPLRPHEQWGDILDRIAEQVRGAPHDAGLREHPAPRRAGGAPPRRAARRGPGRRAHHGSLSKDRAAARLEARLRAGELGGAGRHRVARARHRHRPDRARVPDRLAPEHRHASSSASAAPATPGPPPPRAALPDHARRARRDDGACSAPCARAASTASARRSPRSTSSRSRSSRAGRRRRWTSKTTSLRARPPRGRALSPTRPRRLRRGRRDALQRHPDGAVAGPRYLHRDRINGRPRRAAARPPRRHPRRAAPSPRRRLPRRRRPGRHLRRDRRTRTGRSRAWPATCSSSAARPGASGRVEAGVVRVVRRRRARPLHPLLARRGAGPHRRAVRGGLALRRGGRRRRLDRRATRRPSGASSSRRECRVRPPRATAGRPLPRAPRARPCGRAHPATTSSSSGSSTKPGGMQLVVHAPYGARINRALGLALRKRVLPPAFNFELQAAATDDAMVLSLGPDNSFPLADVPQLPHPRDPGRKSRRSSAAPRPPIFQMPLALEPRTAPSWCCASRGGRGAAARSSAWRADDLHGRRLPRARRLPGERRPADRGPAPPARRARRCTTASTEATDVRRARRVSGDGVRSPARWSFHVRDTTEPSPLAHEILNAAPYAFLDDAPLEERRTRAVALRRGLPRGPATSPSSTPTRSRGSARRRAPTAGTPRSSTTSCSSTGLNGSTSSVCRGTSRGHASPSGAPRPATPVRRRAGAASLRLTPRPSASSCARICRGS